MRSFAHSPPAREAGRTRWVQTTLNRIDDAGLRVDGVWGGETDNALRSFQARQGSDPSGVLGHATLRAIERAGGTIAPAYLDAQSEVAGASQQCRIDEKNRRYVCGSDIAVERRAPLKNADEALLKDVPARLNYYQRRERLLLDPLEAFERMYDAAHREVPGLPASMLKLINGYRGYKTQSGLFKTGLLNEFKGCDTVPQGKLAWLIDRTNDAGQKLPPNPADKGLWPRLFFQIAKANNIDFSCGVEGAKALIQKRRLVIAPPTSNIHQAGSTIDVWLGYGTYSSLREKHIRMPAFRWMVANARRFGFHPYVTEPWHWEFIPGTATEPAPPDGLWSSLLRPFGLVQSEADPAASPGTSSGVFGLFDRMGSLGADVAGAAFSSVEKLWLVSHAQSSGIRDRGKLTDAVFNRRHPDRQGRRIDPNEPDAQALVAEWKAIGDKVVAPVLAYLAQQRSGPPPSAGQSAATSAPAAALGSLPLFSNGREVGRYRFTPEDLEWLAKMLIFESGGGSKPEDRAAAQCVINRYAVSFYRAFKSFAAFLRAFSTTLQPVLTNAGAAARHVNSPEFVKLGGTYPGHPDIPRGQLKRHLEVQRKTWAELPAQARSVATDALTGQLVDPGIGNADDFASTKIYYRQKYKKMPSLAEWRAFTEAYGKTVGKWIGDVPGLDQTANAFFLSKEAMKIPVGAIKVTR